MLTPRRLSKRAAAESPILGEVAPTTVREDQPAERTAQAVATAVKAPPGWAAITVRQRMRCRCAFFPLPKKHASIALLQPAPAFRPPMLLTLATQRL